MRTILFCCHSSITYFKHVWICGRITLFSLSELRIKKANYGRVWAILGHFERVEYLNNELTSKICYTGHKTCTKEHWSNLIESRLCFFYHSNVQDQHILPICHFRLQCLSFCIKKVVLIMDGFKIKSNEMMTMN